MIDTHSHLYDSAFDEDRPEAVARAINAGVKYIMLPAIDSESNNALFETVRQFPEVCLPMAGLHPTSVNGNTEYMKELETVAKTIESPPAGKICGVGETGLDLYWEKEYLKEQKEALVLQAELAIKYDLPLIVHCRDAWPELLETLKPLRDSGLRGIMHAFSGSYDEYKAVREIGDFAIGVGGPVTYKKTNLTELLPRIPEEHVVLETDAPYLPPTPHRGKRNESAYLTIICSRVAEVTNKSPEEVADSTTRNAMRIFGI